MQFQWFRKTSVDQRQTALKKTLKTRAATNVNAVDLTELLSTVTNASKTQTERCQALQVVFT